MQLFELNTFQLEGRYPDYLFEINKKCNKLYTSQVIIQVEGIIQYLMRKM